VGYMVRTLRGVAAGDERLPEWTGWGDLFVTGLLVWVGALVYSIPGIILLRLGPLAVLGSIWDLLVALWMPAAVIRFAMSNNLGSFFDFGYFRIYEAFLHGYSNRFFSEEDLAQKITSGKIRPDFWAHFIPGVLYVTLSTLMILISITLLS